MCVLHCNKTSKVIITYFFALTSSQQVWTCLLWTDRWSAYFTYIHLLNTHLMEIIALRKFKSEINFRAFVKRFIGVKAKYTKLIPVRKGVELIVVPRKRLRMEKTFLLMRLVVPLNKSYESRSWSVGWVALMRLVLSSSSTAEPVLWLRCLYCKATGNKGFVGLGRREGWYVLRVTPEPSGNRFPGLLKAFSLWNRKVCPPSSSCPWNSTWTSIFHSKVTKQSTVNELTKHKR